MHLLAVALAPLTIDVVFPDEMVLVSRLREGKPGVGEEPADGQEPGEERQDHLHDVSHSTYELALCEILIC